MRRPAHANPFLLLTDIQNCIERHPAPSVSATKALPYPSVSVRSSRIAAPKPAVLNKVAAAITELGISTHLVMPTKANVEKLDALQAALGTMVELKKVTDRIEAEIRVATKRREGLVADKAAREGRQEQGGDNEDGDGDEAVQRVSWGLLKYFELPVCAECMLTRRRCHHRRSVQVRWRRPRRTSARGGTEEGVLVYCLVCDLLSCATWM